MSINNHVQPIILHIDEKLRLRKPLKEEYNIALLWYSNKDIMLLSEGITDRVYQMEDINRMYNFLSNSGELYFIEIYEKQWKPIGDVTLSTINVPIVIGDSNYWSKGIGKKVLLRIIGRSIEIGLTYLRVPEVFHINYRSKKLYESVGFVKLGEDDRVTSYELVLSK